MTFRQRIVRLFAWGALAVAGLALVASETGEISGWCFYGGLAVGIGLAGIFRAIWAPRAEP